VSPRLRLERTRSETDCLRAVLQNRDLSGNAFYGAFPEWLGEMTMLRLLNLQRNELSGDIPVSFADNDALELM
jgi:hypothetical protein